MSRRIIGSGRQVWLRTRDTVTNVIRETELVDYQMAGATVLQAKYEHRGSADIDTILTDRGNENAAISAMKRIARETNARIEPAGENIYQLRFSDLPPENHLDIFIRREAPHPQESLNIEGRDEPASTTTEILYGKIFGRGHEAFARDTVDIAIAALEEPLELERAVNAVPESIWRATAAGITNAQNDYHDAIKELDLRSDTARTISKHLADHGLRAVLRARYSSLIIDIKNHQAEIHTDSQLRGPQFQRWSKGGDTRQVLREGWYDQAIAVRSEPQKLEEIVEQVNKTMRDGLEDRIHARCEPFTRKRLQPHPLPARERPPSTGPERDSGPNRSYER